MHWLNVSSQIFICSKCKWTTITTDFDIFVVSSYMSLKLSLLSKTFTTSGTRKISLILMYSLIVPIQWKISPKYLATCWTWNSCHFRIDCWKKVYFCLHFETNWDMFWLDTFFNRGPKYLNTVGDTERTWNVFYECLLDEISCFVAVRIFHCTLDIGSFAAYCEHFAHELSNW